MRRINRVPAIAALLGLFFAGRTLFAIPAAELKQNYQPIIERNPFGLKPPPPPPTNNPTANKAQEKPKTEIFLTGITSIGYPKYPKQVYIMTKEQGKKEPTYYALTEGMEKDGIKVLEIDPSHQKVRINWDNEDTLLTFQTHGVPPPAATGGKPGAPGAPGQPGHPGMQQPGAIPLPNGGQPVNGQPGSVPLSFSPASNSTAGAVTPNASTSYRAIPSRRIRGDIPAPSYGWSGNPSAQGGNLPAQAEQPQIDPAEQYLRMHLDKTIHERQGQVMPPVPPM